MLNRDRASNADGDAFGSVGEAREQSRSRYDDHTSIVSHRGMRFSTCSFTPLLGEKECGLLCATSPSESSPSLTRARYAGTAGLPGHRNIQHGTLHRTVTLSIQGLLATMGVLRFNRLRSWTGQDFYSALEVWADSRETCTTPGERPHLGEDE
jgi:hypothetical protein